MGSKTDTSMTTNTEQKPQKITTPEFDPTKISSSSSDPKTITSPSSNSNCKFGNYPSFSQLLEGVMAANSTVSSNPLVNNLGFQGQFSMSHREALESVTAKAAQARAQMHLQAESAKSSIDPHLMTRPELTVPSSSAVVKEEKSSLPHNIPAEERSEKISTRNTSEAAVSSGQKTPCKLSEPVNPSSVASMSTPREEVDKQDTKQGICPCNTEEHADDTPRTPKPDGYSWRKYGQKQVKSSGSSRSYYRCTTLNCCAKKKVQHLDVSGRIIGVVYKGDHNHDLPQNLKGSSRKKDPLSAVPVPLVPNDHNHDPPQNLKGSSRKKDPLSAVPVPLVLNDHKHDLPQNLKGSSKKKEVRSASPVPLVPNDSSVMSLQKVDDSGTSTHVREHERAVVPVTHEARENNQNTSTGKCLGDAGAQVQNTPKPDPTLRLKNEAAAFTAESERSRSSNSNDLPMTDPMKERDLAPLKKRRIKEGGKANSDTVYRTFKDPKIVVHAAADAGTSNDGYRWRKYGQKMVKGNPNPRSYYRCSSAGCPVRKHVEKATDNSTAIIVTYEGKHDHDMPVPKKRHGSPNSSVCVAASSSATTTPIQNKETRPTSPSQGPPAKPSRDTDGNCDGEVVAEAGADKVLESARTLLSIGIELKSC